MIKMNKLFIIVSLLLLSFHCQNSNEFNVKGMSNGLKRNLGHHFYTIDRAKQMPPSHWESICWYREPYYNKLKIDRADGADISPSGNYALFASDSIGGVYLYNVNNNKKYKILDTGTCPTVIKWINKEDSLFFSYYTDGSHTKSMKMSIKELKQ
jgi:WD40 repeat protein